MSHNLFLEVQGPIRPNVGHLRDRLSHYEMHRWYLVYWQAIPVTSQSQGNWNLLTIHGP